MPFLKKLKLYGFKSFAYKTEIELKDGIMGIVGPNGCGKSNIMDALMWIFGEKSSRLGKIENQADLIFAGTEVHKPLGYAEVEVIIDNENSLLPVEYREVSIKRTITRSGESEFFINNKKCRLKDIYALLADTGIGKGAYSFMEQGRIDMILSNKPEERRILFEEAAGISKYKIRVKESLQKLEKTEQNLAQIEPFLKELKAEYDKLKIQAEEAKKYNELQKKLKELEIQNYVHKYKNYQNYKKELETDFSKLENKINELKSNLSHNEEKLEKLNIELSNYTKNKYETEKENSKIQQLIKSNEEKIQIYKEQIEKNNKLISSRQSEINRLITENQNLTTLFQNKESEIKTLEAEINKIKNERNSIVSEIERIEKMVKTNIETKVKLNDEISKLNLILDEKKRILRKLTAEFVNEIDKKKKEVEGKTDIQIVLKEEIINIIEKIEKNIDSNNISEVKNLLNLLKSKINDIVVHQDEFKNMIFDKNGTYAKKEAIDNEIKSITNQIITNQSRINEIETENHKLLNDDKALNKKLKEVDELIHKYHFKIEVNQNELRKIKADIDKNENLIKNLNDDIKNFSNENARHIKEIENLNNEIIKFSSKTSDFSKSITKIEENINSIKQQISNLKVKNNKIQENINELNNKLNNIRDSISSANTTIKDLENTLFDEYDVRIEDVLNKVPENIDIKTLKENIEKLKIEIRNLGNVNLRAEEEFKDVEQKYNFNLQQKEDLIKAKNDLLSIISESNKESTRLFLETFNKINENFHYIFRRLFGGGKAEIVLEDPENPLESGIIINVQPPGKKLKSINWLSGGERDLSSIALLFSIFLVKPSPFCAFDEIDAELDEENTRKFISLTKEFSQSVQFILISHNPNTIANVDYLYGVSMEEKGISKIVSLELRKENYDKYIKQENEKK